MRKRYPSIPIAVIVLSMNAAPGLGGEARSGIVYEIFVRSFYDADGDPRRIGDLKGIAAKLDGYLNDGDPATGRDLGVDALWMMPIFPSPSYHGYDVTDHRAIHPDYGTLDDFRSLVREAHRRGVRILVDLPLNHTSDRHPWFREAIADPDSPKRAFYHIRPGAPMLPGYHPARGRGGEALSYLGLFSPSMPDLNFENREVRTETEAIAAFWLDQGADGFRLDAAKHIFGDRFTPLNDDEVRRNNAWWREFSDFVYAKKPDAILIGEVLGERSGMVAHAPGLDGLVDEPFMNDVRSLLARPAAGFVGRHRAFLDAVADARRREPAIAGRGHPFHPFDYIGSHDRSPRLGSDFEDARGKGMPMDVDTAGRLSHTILLTLGDRAILYAGDELLQRGRKWPGNPPGARNEPGDGSGIYDETLREPFPWYRSGPGPGQTAWFKPRFDRPDDGVSVEEQDHPGSVLDFVRGLTNLRAKHPALASGELRGVVADTAALMAFERSADGEGCLVLVNLTAEGATFRPQDGGAPTYAGAREVFRGDGRSGSWRDGSKVGPVVADSVEIPPRGVVVLRRAD